MKKILVLSILCLALCGTSFSQSKKELTLENERLKREIAEFKNQAKETAVKKIEEFLQSQNPSEEEQKFAGKIFLFETGKL